MSTKLIKISIIIVIVFTFIFFMVEESNNDITFSIKTDLVEILPPHTHYDEDAIIDHEHTVVATSSMFRIPRDVWIKEMKFKIHNGHESLLHHVVLFNTSKTHPFCKDYPGESLLVFGLGSPTTVHFNGLYGIFLEKGTELFIYGMLHNPEEPEGTGDSYENVFMEIILTTEQKIPTIKKPVEHLILKHEDILCAEIENASIVTVPENTRNYIIKSKSSTKSTPSHYIFEEDSEIISLASHIHPSSGGKKVDIFLNTSLIKTFTPYKHGENPWDWKFDAYRDLISIKKDDILTFESTYSNENNFPIRDAMSIISLYFSPLTEN